MLYNHILHNIVEPLTGSNITYSNDLERIGKHLLGTKFKGVFPSDKIPKLTKNKPYAIANVDASHQLGSHWVAIVGNGKNIILYDSFGRNGIKLMPALQKQISLKSSGGRVIDTDYDSEQKMKEENCGARSLGFLLFYDKYGKDMSLMI